MKESVKLPVFYIPHGGGPWNVMEESFGGSTGYGALKEYLVELGNRYREKAKALLVISAHWEEPKPAIHFGAAPGMLYDYGGFPDFTYRLKWPAPGHPELAARIEGLLAAAGFSTTRESGRGYDHGTFVPLMVAFPEARLPVAQVSLVNGLDPAVHFALGQALEPLRSEKVLIIGSGMSYHNMRGFMSSDPRVGQISKRFDDWLAEAVAIEDLELRREALVGWRMAPGALECHPRSEHLVPLFVAAGAAGSDGGRREYAKALLGVSVSSHIFGQA
jgi:aromatic ring-opening dioxygenase catalytic subunit (LigB family)